MLISFQGEGQHRQHGFHFMYHFTNPYINQWKTCHKRRCCNVALHCKENLTFYTKVAVCHANANAHAKMYIYLSGKKLFTSNETRLHLKAESYFSAKTTLWYIFNSFHALMLLLLSDFLWPYHIHQENKMFCQHISNLMDHDFYLPARIWSLHVLFYGYYLRQWAMAVSPMNHF